LHQRLSGLLFVFRCLNNIVVQSKYSMLPIIEEIILETTFNFCMTWHASRWCCLLLKSILLHAFSIKQVSLVFWSKFRISPCTRTSILSSFSYCTMFQLISLVFCCLISHLNCRGLNVYMFSVTCQCSGSDAN
jgi:hypothetical protein